MWASVQEGITAANDDPIGAGNDVLDKALGPSFDYLQTIRSPAEKGVSSDGNFDQVFTNANAINDYVGNLIRGPKVGNQFFQSTGGKCRAPDGNVVDRWSWINNKLGGDDASGVLGPSFQRAVSGSGFDGIIPGAAGDMAMMNPLKIMNALVLDGIPPCQEYTCPVTDMNTGASKGTETHYLSPSLELSLRGCTPASVKEGFVDGNVAPYYPDEYLPSKMMSTDTTPYLLWGLAIVTFVAYAVASKL
jgi:hypothetical protein